MCMSNTGLYVNAVLDEMMFALVVSSNKVEFYLPS